MSGVDVLAVLEQAANALNYAGANRKGIDSILMARAAVAEVIAKAQALADAVAAETEYLETHKLEQVSEADEHKAFESRVVECTAELRIALANAKGGAA